MKHGMFAVAGAALLLAACGSAKEEDAATKDAVAAPAAAAEPAVADAAAPAGPVEAGSKPTREFMLGKWGEDGDCVLAIDFKADGTMDGPVEKWSLEDGKLLMEGMPQKMHLKVVDDKTMESQIDGKGEVSKLTRC